jgi:hypothetical protein
VSDIALVAVQWHRRYLRRYIKLQLGAPEGFTCAGGWHEAVVQIGDYPGEIERDSREERQLRPPRIDERWPLKCDGCDYEFTFRDRYQLITVPLREIDNVED